jgi:hypothetical protein
MENGLNGSMATGWTAGTKLEVAGVANDDHASVVRGAAVGGRRGRGRHNRRGRARALARAFAFAFAFAVFVVAFLLAFGEGGGADSEGVHELHTTTTTPHIKH